MKANIDVKYEASSIPYISKKVNSSNRSNIAGRLLDEITSLKNDLDIKEGDRYQIIIRKLDVYVSELPKEFK